MKKTLLALVTAAGLLSTTSCEPVRKEFETKEYSFDVTLPVTASGATTTSATVNQEMNFEKEIHDVSEGAATLKNVQSVKVKMARLDLVNADNENNLANFKTMIFEISAPNSAGTTTNALGMFDDQYGTAYEFYQGVFSNGAEVGGLLEEPTWTYKLNSDLRRATTKDLQAKIKVRFTVLVEIPNVLGF